jgi:hypothetical protein
VDYQRIYDELILSRKESVPNGYTENHHIIPSSLGGSDEKSNLVRLTGREHWIAHLLLHKIHRRSETAYACDMMAMRCEERGIPLIRNSKMYQAIRIECARYSSIRMAILQRGEDNSQFGTRWICNTILRENKKISKIDELPQGWILGRNKWKVKAKPNKIEERKQTITATWTALYLEWSSSGISIDRFIKSKGYAGASSATKMWSRLGLYTEKKQNCPMV